MTGTTYFTFQFTSTSKRNLSTRRIYRILISLVNTALNVWNNCSQDPCAKNLNTNPWISYIWRSFHSIEPPPSISWKALQSHTHSVPFCSWEPSEILPLTPASPLTWFCRNAGFDSGSWISGWNTVEWKKMRVLEFCEWPVQSDVTWEQQ